MGKNKAHRMFGKNEEPNRDTDLNTPAWKLNRRQADLGERAVRVACLKGALEMRSVAKPMRTVIAEAMEFEEYVLGHHSLQDQGSETRDEGSDEKDEPTDT